MSFLVSRSLASLLYGTTATEPTAYAGAAAILLTVAVAASWLPARASTRNALQSILAE